MTTRRGLFRMLAGLAATPIMKRLAPVMPAPEPEKIVIGEYADYLQVSDFTFRPVIVGTTFIGWIHPQVAADLQEEGFEL